MNPFRQFDDTLRHAPVTKALKRKPFEMPPLFRIQSGAIALYQGKILVDIVKSDEYAGTLLYPDLRVAVLEDCELMTWQNLVLPSEPLAEFFRARWHTEILRLETACSYYISDRTVNALLWLAGRVGVTAGPDWVALPIWVTHELIASRVVTSREITTKYIGNLRALGVMDRRNVNPEGLQSLLQG